MDNIDWNENPTLDSIYFFWEQNFPFRFELEERHTWLAASLEEKDAFLKVVQTMCERYNVGRKTKFLNLKPAEVLVGEAASARGQVNIRFKLDEYTHGDI